MPLRPQWPSTFHLPLGTFLPRSYHITYSAFIWPFSTRKLIHHGYLAKVAFRRVKNSKGRWSKECDYNVQSMPHDNSRRAFSLLLQSRHPFTSFHIHGLEQAVLNMWPSLGRAWRCSRYIMFHSLITIQSTHAHLFSSFRPLIWFGP